jgi:hypothetical protein
LSFPLEKKATERLSYDQNGYDASSVACSGRASSDERFRIQIDDFPLESVATNATFLPSRDI